MSKKRDDVIIELMKSIGLWDALLRDDDDGCYWTARVIIEGHMKRDILDDMWYDDMVTDLMKSLYIPSFTPAGIVRQRMPSSSY